LVSDSVRSTRCCARKLPSDVIQDGSEVMDDFPSENAESEGNAPLAMVIDGLLENLFIFMGDGGVVAIIEKDEALGVQIQDVLIGPF